VAATASPQSARLRRGYGGQAVHSSESAIHRPLRGRGDGGDRARGHNWLKLVKIGELQGRQWGARGVRGALVREASDTHLACGFGGKSRLVGTLRSAGAVHKGAVAIE